MKGFKGQRRYQIEVLLQFNPLEPENISKIEPDAICSFVLVYLRTLLRNWETKCREDPSSPTQVSFTHLLAWEVLPAITY